MSKNEDIRKSKLLMQQNLSHGAPSPKLSKMLEVLLDHFSMWHVILLYITKMLDNFVLSAPPLYYYYLYIKLRKSL